MIPVRDDAGRLRECLASIRANDYPAEHLEMVVVDNGSRDRSAAVAAEMGAVVLSRPGLVVGAVRNDGARAASGDILAFVDSDHVIDEQWVRSAVGTLDESGAAATGALCHAPEGGTWVQRTYDGLRSHRPGVHETDWLGSGNLAIRRDVFLRVGGFDASLESCEDVDLCNRLRAAGHRLVTDDRLHNVHLGDPRTLRALFLGELWRGRDNLRVTLRGPLTMRALPSVAIPVANLLFLAAGALGVATTWWGGLWLAAGGAIGFGMTALLRVLRMSGRNRKQGAREFLQNLAVASTYELARALALVMRATHRTRRELTAE